LLRQELINLRLPDADHGELSRDEKAVSQDEDGNRNCTKE
jgi:hypothetical protein